MLILFFLYGFLNINAEMLLLKKGERNYIPEFCFVFECTNNDPHFHCLHDNWFSWLEGHTYLCSLSSLGSLIPFLYLWWNFRIP